MTAQADVDLPVFDGLPPNLKLTGYVGTGAQKTIYRAFDRDRNREIAVICLDRRADHRTAVARVQEMQALTGIRAHPHVLELLDVVETDDHLILCVPYLSRGDLARHLASAEHSPIPVREALRIGVQLADAIAHIHRHGFIHGDIKAKNVLIADDGAARLSDFGFAHLGTVPATARPSGTLTHLAPERIRGEQADERSDLYSFGCLLYELFSGRPPIVTGSPSELLNLHLMAHPPALQGHRREVPIGISQLVDRMLSKQPADRPQSSLEVYGALSAALRADAFLSIDEECSTDLPSRMDGEARIDRIMRGAREGRAAIVFVTGEPGSGKSETLRRLGRRAREYGFGVSAGDAQEKNAVPYAPMIDSLMALAGDLTGLEADQADQFLEFLYLKHSHPGRSNRDVTRERLFASIMDLLNKASQRRPILLVLEDLHEADEATVELLTYFEYALSARKSIRGLDLLIVASCRSNAIPKRVEEMMRRAGAGAIAACIGLEPLDARDVVRLAAGHGLASREQALLDRIVSTSVGNALSVVEIVRLMQGQGRDADRSLPLPPSEFLARSQPPLDAHGLVARKLEARSPRCRQALELAAILGIEFEAALVERLARALDFEVGTGLDEALKHGILVDRGGRLGFSHPLLRDELNRSIPGERRAWVHLKRIEILQTDEVMSEERRDLEIAQHLIAAADYGNTHDLVEYATRAGNHALARFAWSEAARFFDAAIARFEVDGTGAKIASLHHRSGIAYFRLLDSTPCLEHFARAASLYSEQGDDTNFARVSLDRARAVSRMGLMGTPEFARSRRELEDCLERVSASHRLLRAEMLSVLAEQIWAENNPAQAEVLCVEALEETRPEVDHLLRAEISVTLGLAQLSRLNQQAALSTWRSGALHGRRADDLSSTARCLQRVRIALFVSGRIGEVRELIDEVAALNEILQMPSEAALTHAISAATSVLAGDFEHARSEIERGVNLLSRARYPWALALMASTRACAHALTGDLNGALSALEEFAESPIYAEHKRDLETFSDRHRSLVNYYVGDPVGFPPTRRADLIAQLENRDCDEIGLYQACIALELASAQQDDGLARVAVPIVEEALARGWILTTGWPFFVPRLVGAGKLILGDVRGAVAALEKALLLATIDELPIEWGRIRFDLSRALVFSHDESSRERAKQLAREARDVFWFYPRNAFLERANGLVRYFESES